jgi:AmmeMemoRadiSam system protein A
MALMSLTKPQQTVLLTLAWESIAHGLKTGKPLSVNPDEYPPELVEPRATFVTLERQKELRGCIGMLEAIRPLVEDVAENAFAAAFCDRRFLALTDHELDDLEVHISILSPAEEMTFGSELDLLAQLRPHVDGLILQEGSHRATFLPSVWESLHAPMQFLQQLKLKAGLPAAYWSKTIKAYRYTTESIG